MDVGRRTAGRLVVLLVLTLPLAASAGCGADEPRVPAGPLRIATGSSTGTYFSYGDGIASVVRKRLPALRPEVLQTDASAQNLRMVADGAAELGFAQADAAADAAAEQAPVMALARLYDDYLHLVVPANSEVSTLADLRGRRVSIGAQGSGTLITVNRLLATVDLRPGDLRPVYWGLDKSAEGLRGNEIDAFFFSGGPPVSAVTALRKDLAIRLVDIGRHAAELRQRHGQFYAEHTVPASTYGLARPSSTIGIANYLVVSRRMPDDTAYALSRALYQEKKLLAEAHPVAGRLNPREGINTYPLRLHPGAARWYREAKG